jgi:hypothetical protein
MYAARMQAHLKWLLYAQAAAKEKGQCAAAGT